MTMSMVDLSYRNSGILSLSLLRFFCSSGIVSIGVGF